MNGLVQAYEETAKLLADFDLLNKVRSFNIIDVYSSYGAIMDGFSCFRIIET